MNAQASSVIIADDHIQKRERPLAMTPASDANTALLQVIANAARDPNVDVAKMQALFAMHTQAKAQAAAMAYAAAMAEFKLNPPKIVKDKHVAFQTSKGVTEYDHATLGHVCDQIIEGLASVGVSHRWDLEQLDGGMIRVTCVLTHAEGHSVGTSLQSSRDDSGSKNNIQAVASAVTYLQRYTLLAATGLAAGVADNDGRGAEGYEAVSEEQEANLQALITEVGADKARFLDYFKRERLCDIPADSYKTAVAMLVAKRRASK